MTRTVTNKRWKFAAGIAECDALVQENDWRGLLGKLDAWKYPKSFPEYRGYTEKLGALEAGFATVLERIRKAQDSNDWCSWH